MRLRQISRIADVSPAAWNALFPAAYPFARHEFLHLLEEHGCVGPGTGWTPAHVLLEDAEGALLGAAPLYLKSHSWGEFVFDFRWAEAAQRLGRAYYPKLLCAIPFTPATGPRLGAQTEDARIALAQGLVALAEARQCSSAHALFLQGTDAAALRNAAFLERVDVQFHWENRGYRHFDDFLQTLRAEKRRKIRQERRRVADAGIRFTWCAGNELGAAQWHAVYALYANTYEERGQPPYLSESFFQDYGRRSDTPLRLILAHDGARLVAVAITVLGGDVLYGRHWGAAGRYHGLHFETCYYQGIERCIEAGVRVYDAGAQGEHKLARGFTPVLTHSAHYLLDAPLHRAVEAHLQKESAFVRLRGTALSQHGPYKEGALSNG